MWEQTLEVELDYDLIVQHPHGVAVFEIIGSPRKLGRTGWGGGTIDPLPVVCWCFLKLQGAAGPNSEMQARLQLYEYPAMSRHRTGPGKDGADENWGKRIQKIVTSAPRKRYPSTLYVLCALC